MNQEHEIIFIQVISLTVKPKHLHKPLKMEIY